MTKARASVLLQVERGKQASILVADGVLDSATYLQLRDAVIEAALDGPRAVIVDVDSLIVPDPSAWTVFSSARWHVSRWPDVPILLACGHRQHTQAIAAHRTMRFVPVYPTRAAALAAANGLSAPRRRRARAQLNDSKTSVTLARTMIREWLTAWAASGLIPVAGTVATVFIENVLRHTDSAPVLIVEWHNDAVAVAVRDTSRVPASRRESATGGTEMVSGLAIVNALCRAWGSTPTPSGKTVWALVGSENQL